MKSTRYVLLTTSIVLVIAMLGSGMAVRVGAEDGSYRETVKFAEIMSTILDYYVDSVESEDLLRGAYEGMLGGLDANGAYLTPEEVGLWREDRSRTAGPGISIRRQRLPSHSQVSSSIGAAPTLAVVPPNTTTRSRAAS